MRPDLRDVEFRPLTERDQSFVLELSRAEFAQWAEDPGATFTGAMFTIPASIVEVAWERDERLGFFVLIMRPPGKVFGTFECPASGHVEAIAVSSLARGRGVGAALIERAEELAIQAGAIFMTLSAAVSNTAMQALVAKVGYRPFLQDSTYANGDAVVELFKPLAVPGA